MGFKSILKAIGEDSLKIVRAVEGGPTVVIQDVRAVEQKIATAVTDLRTVVDLIKQAERMFTAAGMQSDGPGKLAAITPEVNGVLRDIEVLGGTTLGSAIKDEPGFNEGVQTVINGLVKCINSCEKKGTPQAQSA